MTGNEIIKKIIKNIPQHLLEISEDLQAQGINKEIKLCYYLYKKLTNMVLEADIDFQVADSYEQKKIFYKKDYGQVKGNKFLCRHVAEIYRDLIKEAINKYRMENINLDITIEIEKVYPEDEISHVDVILKCNGKTIYCNPLGDALEGKANYIFRRFGLNLAGHKNQQYVERLKAKYGEFVYLDESQIKKLDESVENRSITIYRNDVENMVFEELATAVADLKDNKKEESKEGSEAKYTESGLYVYLKHNKEKYDLEDDVNLIKSKVDFILDTLSDIREDQEETNVMAKYIYYTRLIKRLCRENEIGNFYITPCKYRNGNKEDVNLLLLLRIGEERFSYLLLSGKQNFQELPVAELRKKIRGEENSLIIYRSPYQRETGPMTEGEREDALGDFMEL